MPTQAFIAKYKIDKEDLDGVETSQGKIGVQKFDVLDLDELETSQERRYLKLDEYKEWVNRQVREAKNQGLKQVDRFENILMKRMQAFGGSIDDLRPAKVTPLSVKIKEGEQPIFIKPRKCSYTALIWLKKRMTKLISLGLARMHKNPHWGVPVFIKGKPGKVGEYRLLFDLRAINEKLVMTSLPLPQLESMLNSLSESSIYAVLDLLKGFNALPIAEDSQGIFVAVTPFGCVELLVAPQGCILCPGVFHDRVTNEVLTDDYIFHALNWIDDCLVKGKDEEQFLTNLDRILEKFEKSGFKISVSKAVLFAYNVIWAGRQISKGTIKFEQRCYNRIMEWASPKYGNELSQFLFALNWIKPTIVQARPSITYLRDKVLEPIYATCKSRTEKELAKRIIGALWTEEAAIHFGKIKRAVKNSVALTIPDYNKQFCIFTDSCEYFWGFMVTQIPVGHEKLPYAEQQHELIAIMDNKYNDTQIKYHISQKEAGPLVFGLKRFGYLFQILQRPILIYNDHKNIESIFNPSKEYNRAVLSRLYRWSLEIQQFWFKVHHIKGEDNVWVDMISRWIQKEYHAEKRDVACMTINYKYDTSIYDAHESEDFTEYEQFLYDRVRPLHNPEFDYPDVEKIRAAQLAHEKDQLPFPPELEYNALTKLFEWRGKAWIPDVKTQTRIIVLAHTITGHSGNKEVISEIQKHFYWRLEKMKHQAAKFKSVCMHCLSSYPKKRRMKYGTQRSATARNEIIHMDYLYLYKNLYLLVLKDDVSNKIEFELCKAPDSRITAIAVLYWRARYGLLLNTEFVSDRGSHFANEFMRSLSKDLKYKQRFCVAYAPWSNGRIERVNKDILKFIRILKSEFRVSDLDLNLIIPQVLYYINQSHTDILDGYSPNDIFMGPSANSSPLEHIIYKVDQKVLKIEIGKVEPYLKSFKEQLDGMLTMVISVKEKIRQQRNLKLNERLGVKDVHFQEGDLVLKAQLRPRSKTCMTWIGPYMVHSVKNDHVNEVQDIMDEEIEEVHAVFLRLYEEKYYLITEDIKEQYIHDASEYEVEKFVDIKMDDELLLLTKWRGFPPQYNSWEPYSNMIKDVPAVVNKFKQKHPEKGHLWRGM